VIFDVKDINLSSSRVAITYIASEDEYAVSREHSLESVPWFWQPGRQLGPNSLLEFVDAIPNIALSDEVDVGFVRFLPSTFLDHSSNHEDGVFVVVDQHVVRSSD
jgi:hypothetical protein